MSLRWLVVAVAVAGCSRTPPPSDVPTVVDYDPDRRSPGSEGWDEDPWGEDDETGIFLEGCAAGPPSPFWGALNGVPRTTLPYSSAEWGTELAQVRAAVVAAGGFSDVTLSPPVEVSAAIVSALGFASSGNPNFWVADASDAIRTELSVPPSQRPAAQVGDKVSFEVRKARISFGQLQIREIAGFSIVEVGGVPSRGNAVSYVEAHRTPLDLEDDGKIIYAHGEVLRERGPCGPATCWDLQVGPQELVFRLSGPAQENVVVGDCIAFLGPVQRRIEQQVSFLQIDATQYAWYRKY